MSKVSVSLDDRTRLVSALLAASSWPGREQAVRTHAVHPYAKLTRQFAQPWHTHPAVTLTNTLLDQGVDVEDLFTAALRPTADLPTTFDAANWVAQLTSFGAETKIAANFWPRYEAEWQQEVKGLQEIFKNSLLPDFLGELQGKALTQNIVMVPNIVHPALTVVLAATADTLYVLPNLPVAWGESPPWPYHEGEDAVLSSCCHRLMEHLLADTLAQMDEHQAKLLKYAAAAILIERVLNESEGLSYMVRSKKQFGIPTLPLAIEALRDYLIAPAGRSLATLDLG